MKIKAKLSFQFTFIVAGILIFFSALVFYFSYTSQHDRFSENLTERAKNTAILLINVSEVDSALLNKIQTATLSWENEEIAVTDSAFHLLYSIKLHYLTDKVIRQNSDVSDVSRFSIAEKDGVCYKHRFKNQTYNVLVMAFDKSRKENLSDLRKILVWSVIFSIWLSVLLSYFFAKNAIHPISQIIKSVSDINSSRLNNRLNEGNKKDEIAQLAITFNEMLTNLEIAFNNQEDFVSNASHELRTPLSVMISESDYLLSHEQNTEVYRNHILVLVKDLRKLNSQLNTLLELAHLNKENSIQLSEVRLDEIIFSAIESIKTRYPGRKIIPKVQYPENENELLIRGNYGMLVVAVSNLLDNACKFSNDDVIIEILMIPRFFQVIISDKGIGIPKNELENIYQPFKRASNVKFISGFGIGLALVAKIFELHEVNFKVHSVEKNGTRFELLFKSSR